MTTRDGALRRPSLAEAVTPIASLAMYDGPELQDANDALWSAITHRLADRGVAAPARLTRGVDLDRVWTSPSLLLGQTCGYPLVTRLAGAVQIVATPSYRAPGCEGPFRRSAIVVRKSSRAQRLGDLRAARCVINDRASDSGMNLLRGAIAPLARGEGFFSEVTVTGAHLASAEAVACGEADVAALDAVSFAHLSRHRGDIAGQLRVLAWTERSPGLPLITAARTGRREMAILRQVLGDVARAPELAEVRGELLWDGLGASPTPDYAGVLEVEQRARTLGYPELR